MVQRLYLLFNLLLMEVQSPQGNKGGTLNHPIGGATGGMCCGFLPTNNQPS